MKKHMFTFKKCNLALAVMASCIIGCVHAEDIKFSGFLSVGGGFVSDDKSIPYGGYSEEDLSFDRNIVGLQATGNMTDKVSATAQLIARSEKNYELKAEWAYITYKATDSIKIRAGRLRTPFYIYSDFLDVGYAYSWIAPPREVYYLPFNNVDGVDVYVTHPLGSFDTTLQAYYGSFNDTLNFQGKDAAAKTRKQMGVAATLGKDWWTLRAAYHVADLSIDVSASPLSATTTIGSFAQTLGKFGFQKNADNLLVDGDSASFAEIGGTIDTGKFVAAAEHVEFKPGKSLLSKNVREYVMLGVRQGDWLFHVTAQKSKDEQATPEVGIPAGVALPVVGSTNVLIGTLQQIAKSQVVDRNVLSIGTRWDFTAGTALKLQVDDVDDSAGKQKVVSVAVQTVF